MTVIDEIAVERRRQVEVEGWSIEHDDSHDNGQMAAAAACYAMSAYSKASIRYWSWDMKWWKPKTPRRDLIRAAALIVAEIERLDRTTPGRLVPHHGSGPDNV